MVVNPETFRHLLARARTFCFERDIEPLRSMGLIRGGSLENAIVLTNDGVMNGPLRFPDEFGRHKTLDLIGDLALIGRPLLARVVAHKAGHALHTQLVSRLLADIEGDAPALVRRSEQREWVDPATGFRRRLVSPPAVGFDCELLSCELPVGARIDYPLPPRLGLEHHLFLMDGALELTVEGTVHRLHAGDCLRFKLMGPSRFVASGQRPARYILVLR